MGSHLKVLSKSYLMNTNMTMFRWLLNLFVSLCFGQVVALALEELKNL